jgi:CBS domain-containing protein
VGQLVASSALASACAWLGYINLTLAAFNLLPGFPLDGGRVLRAATWAWSGNFHKATRWASYSGQAFALILVGVGAYRLLTGEWLGGFWLMLLGGLLQGAARAPYESLRLKDRLHEWRVLDLMTADVVSLTPETTLDRAITQTLAHHDYASYPVIANGLLVGILSTARVLEVPPQVRSTTRVMDVMGPVMPEATLGPEMPGDLAYDELLRREVGRLPVVQDGQLVGMLSERDLARRVSFDKH